MKLLNKSVSCLIFPQLPRRKSTEYCKKSITTSNKPICNSNGIPIPVQNDPPLYILRQKQSF